MALVVPFRGVRYNPDKVTQIKDVLTPPYDVINEEMGSSFLKKNPWNMIQLDLRNTGQQAGGDRERFKRARTLFDQWQEDGILIRDERPSIYLYFIEYTHPSGRRLTRRGLIGLVELTPFSEGIVRPHEETFAGVISERLELMETCQAQFSQVFSLYHDPEHRIMSLLEKAREPGPLARAEDRDGNVHTLYRVSDTDALCETTRLFADKNLYIADGHHRYTTALALRDKTRKQTPDLAADHPVNFIMMYLCDTEDPGLSVLPTHRLLRYPGLLTADRAAEMVGREFSVQEVSGGSRETLVRNLLARMDEAALAGGRPVLGMIHPGEDRAFFLQVRPESLAGKMGERKPELRHLDVVVLSDLLLEQALGLDHERLVREGLVSYHSDMDVALDTAVKESVTDDDHTPLLFLLNPTRVGQVTAIADQGLIMPHKSTYFYPKILTGLVLNKLSGPVRADLSCLEDEGHDRVETR